MTITLQDVSIACEAIMASGGTPTILSVRAKLKKGSESTIQPLLKEWKINSRAQNLSPAIEIPLSVTREIVAWAKAFSTSARAELEERLFDAETDASELARCGVVLENECASLRTQISLLMTSRDAAEATALERQKEIDRLSLDLERERAHRNSNALDAAGFRMSLESQGRQLSDLMAVHEVITMKMEEDSIRRIEAEKVAAVSTARCESAQLLAEDCRNRSLAMQKQLDFANSTTEKIRNENLAAMQQERLITDRISASAEKLTIENKALKAKIHRIVEQKSRKSVAAPTSDRR